MDPTFFSHLILFISRSIPYVVWHLNRNLSVTGWEWEGSAGSTIEEEHSSLKICSEFPGELDFEKPVHF